MKNAGKGFLLCLLLTGAAVQAQPDTAPGVFFQDPKDTLQGFEGVWQADPSTSIRCADGKQITDWYFKGMNFLLSDYEYEIAEQNLQIRFKAVRIPVSIDYTVEPLGGLVIEELNPSKPILATAVVTPAEDGEGAHPFYLVQAGGGDSLTAVFKDEEGFCETGYTHTFLTRKDL